VSEGDHRHAGGGDREGLIGCVFYAHARNEATAGVDVDDGVRLALAGSRRSRRSGLRSDRTGK